jgi:hypothetical protein
MADQKIANNRTGLGVMSSINGLTARFESEETEHQYRQVLFSQDKKKITVLLLLMSLCNLAFTYSDFVLPDRKWLASLLVLRLTTVVISLAVIGVCRKAASEKTIDNTMLAAMFLYSLFFSFCNITRPVDYYFYLLLDVVSILVFYLYIPIRLIFQIAAATFFTLSEWSLFFYLKESPGTGANLALGVSFVASNLIGFLAARSHHISSRKMFCSWITEKELREKYAEAISRIKTLSGLLPICASCKKIRDDKGYWNHIENYIREHSEAEFTHGLCPDCIKKLYPQLLDKS